MVSFEDMLQAFGVVTVMDACIYKLRPGLSYVGRGACVHGGSNGGALKPEDFVCTGLYLDTLKIANLNQEGPTKTITGGQYANPLLKFGKTMTMEAQDALGRVGVLTEFFGCEYENGVLSVTDKFPGAFAIEGKTFFVDQKTGEQVDAYILIPQFLPDALLNLTQDAEGNAAVFDLNGSVSVTEIKETNDAEKGKKVFYQIREKSWFHPQNQSTEIDTAEDADMKDSDYHEKEVVGNKLATPVLVASDNQVTWESVAEADSYIVKDIENNVVKTTTDSNYSIEEGQDSMTVVVKAISFNDSIKESDWSEPCTITKTQA